MIVDAVYPLGKGSKLNNEEIRFSLRSLFMHGDNIGKVYIIGEAPKIFEWGERLIHIPYEDAPRRPYRNVWGKLRAIAGDERISERFIFLNDDFYLLRAFDASNVPNFTQGVDLANRKVGTQTLETILMADITRPYDRVLKNTLNALRRLSLPTRIYATHQPVNFERSKIPAVCDTFAQELRLPYGLSFRCCYGNYYRLPHVTRPTRIIRQEFTPPNGPLAFASHDQVHEEVFMQGIRRLYPTPTPFEVRLQEGV